MATSPSGRSEQLNTPPNTEEFADKVFTAALGTMETFNLYLGERLGWLDAVAEAPATPAELAEQTRTNTRYAVEWLEAQAAYGTLTVVDDGAGDQPGARIADIGCGAGWSSMALASAYPSSNVLGVDVDEPSIQAANANAEAAGVADRTRFVIAAGQTLSELGPFDAAFAFECIHDMPRPVDVLAAIHGAVRPDGLVVIMDEAVADEFRAPGDQVEQLMYGFSTLICLPDGLSSTPSEGTGTVMRRSILTDYAKRAGFSSVEVLPIEDFGFWRFYQLHH